PYLRVAHVLAFDLGTTGPHRIPALVVPPHLDLQGVALPGLDLRDAFERLLWSEIVKGSNFVLGAPLAPVHRRVGAEELGQCWNVRITHVFSFECDWCASGRLLT